MTPTERAQAGAALALAQASREQCVALMHQAEAQIASLNALLGAEPPSAEAQASMAKIFGKEPEPEGPRYYGSRNRKPLTEGADTQS
jgi:outer membrane protein TolC